MGHSGRMTHVTAVEFSQAPIRTLQFGSKTQGQYFQLGHKVSPRVLISLGTRKTPNNQEV